MSGWGLRQWLGVCDPTYRKANEAHMIFSTLSLWLKGIINTRVGEAAQHTRTAPTLKELSDFLKHRFYEYDPSRADERCEPSPPGWLKGKCPSSTWRSTILVGNVCCL